MCVSKTTIFNQINERAANVAQIACLVAALVAADSASRAFAQATPGSGIVQVQGGDAAAPRNFNIPAQPLGRALNTFGRQSGLQVTLSAATSRGVTSNAVNGSFTPEQALSLMLRNTGITFRVTADRTAVIGATSSPAASSSVPGAIQLDTLEVSGGRNAISGAGYQGTPDWVYETPAAVSVISREAIQNSPTRNARDLFDNVAGVYANRAEAQRPGISVNIRGLQDQDRIAMMIDGARQNFQRNGHGATQQTFVDTAFVRAVEIEKSSTSGVGSLGSLGGLVNFRTIIADDLVKPGQQWGSEINAATGTNGFRFDGSAASAVRLSDSFSILGGVSHKNIGPYEVGKNGDLNLSTTYNGRTMLFSGQEVLSSILKAEAKITDDTKLTLGWVRNESDFSTGYYDRVLGGGALRETTQNVINNTFTSAFDWKPDGNLIDLKTRFYYNHTANEDNGVVINGISRNYTMATLGGSVENTSRFDTGLGALSFNYGAEAFSDNGKTRMPSFVVNGIDQTDSLNGGMPGGKRDVAGGFANAKLEHDDWLTIQGGVRYDWYHINGSTTIYGNERIIQHPGVCSRYFADGVTCRIWRTRPWSEVLPPLPYNVNVDRSEAALLPTFTVAVKPYDWLQPFVKYSKSFRPPTIMESFLNSGHANQSNEFAPNPYLKPERGDTYELGANISANRIFTDRDSVRFKVVGFYREIEDYIALGRAQNLEAGRLFSSFVNLNGITRMRGAEIEASYDARSWYLGGTLTLNKTDWAETYTLNGANEYLGSNISVLFVQPEMRVTIDGGVRLFDEKLTIGGRMNRVGETAPTIGSLQNNYKLDGYAIYDLYGSYAFNDSTKLRFAVNNLTDKAYVSALGADYYAMPGRTATVSLNFKF